MKKEAGRCYNWFKAEIGEKARAQMRPIEMNVHMEAQIAASTVGQRIQVNP